MDKQQFVKHVIIPSLEALNEGLIFPNKSKKQFISEEDILLLLGTATIESNCGQYLVQKNGPALGIYQIEPATYNWIKKRLSLKNSKIYDNDKLITDLVFSTIICRMIYWYKTPFPLPTTPIEIADYYKRYYNTIKGKTKIEYAIEVFKKLEKDVQNQFLLLTA